jgi:hypothetical protein
MRIVQSWDNTLPARVQHPSALASETHDICRVTDRRELLTANCKCLGFVAIGLQSRHLRIADD